MQVLLDGEIIVVNRATLAAALEAGRAAAERRRRVVVEARLDGRPLSNEELASPPREELGHDGAVIEFVSAEPRALVRVTLLELVPMLDEARQRQEQAAASITAGKLQEGLEKLGSAFEVWNAVQRAVSDGIELLGMDAGQVEVLIDGESVAVEGYIQGLSSALSEVKRALKAQDLSGLTDVLLYDLRDQAERWQELLRALAELAQRG
jgi:hypothetical protein